MEKITRKKNKITMKIADLDDLIEGDFLENF
jgi:hypothetical protein